MQTDKGITKSLFEHLKEIDFDIIGYNTLIKSKNFGNKQLSCYEKVSKNINKCIVCNKKKNECPAYKTLLTAELCEIKSDIEIGDTVEFKISDEKPIYFKVNNINGESAECIRYDDDKKEMITINLNLEVLTLYE